mgnify:CR=1 FL=1
MFNRHQTLAMSLLAALSVPAVFAQEPAVKALLEQGKYWQSRENSERAAEAWQKLLKLNPNQPEALGGMAVVEASNKRFDEAAKYIAQLKKAAPSYPGLANIEQSINVMRNGPQLQTARDLAKAGIRIIATGDLTDEDLLDAVGDNALGITTSFHYADAHKSPENQAYTDAYAKAYPKDRPNFMSVGGYDGMQLIAKALEKTKGDASGEKFIEAAKGMSWNSPRGPVSIDPVTRDIVQTIYIRKVTRVGSKLQNVEFDQVPAFKDPGKQ